MPLAEAKCCFCRGWQIAYNSLLHLHAKTGRAEQAEAVYQGMLLHGPCPDKNSANSAIAAFASVRTSYVSICSLDYRLQVQSNF